MNFKILSSAALVAVVMTACASESKKTGDTIIDTIEITAEQNEAIDSLTSAASLPYNAEFFMDKANEGAPGDSAKWTATPSGLKYTVIKMGTGRKPSASETVVAHYAGEMTDGTPFDSSYQRGEPIPFGLNQVIAGWTEGLQLMPVGSVFEFYIPAALAYGERGQGPIPPNAPLLFKVELVGIQ